MIKIEAAQRLLAARTHSALEKKYEGLVQDALDDADIPAEPGVNFPEPTLTLDPKGNLKEILDVVGKAIRMKSTKNHALGADVFSNGDIAVIVFSKGGKPNRIVVSEQSED